MRLRLHRPAIALPLSAGALGVALASALLLEQGLSADPPLTSDLIVGSVLAPLAVLLLRTAALEWRRSVWVSGGELRLPRGLAAWRRLPVAEVHLVELVLLGPEPLVEAVRLGIPSRWALVVASGEAVALVRRYDLAPDPRDSGGPADVVRIVRALKDAQGPAGLLARPGGRLTARPRWIGRHAVIDRWPKVPMSDL